MNQREQIIQNYITSYNNFDTKGMVKDLDPMIEFENISAGETNLSLHGLESFVKQAETAKKYFSKRSQQIKRLNHQADETEIEVDYSGILAVGIPTLGKKGKELKITGKSIFKFRGNKIIKITDIS